MAQDETLTGHCKHGEFDLLTGCPDCIAEAQEEARGRPDEPFEDHTADDAEEAWKRDQADIPGLPEVDPNAWRTGEEEVRTEPPELDPLSMPDRPMLPATALIKVSVDDDVAVQRFKEEGAIVLKYAQERVIATNEDLKPATDDLASIKNLKEALEEKRREYVRPIRERLDGVIEIFKEILAPFEEADRLTRGKVNTFRDEQRRLADEAARIEAEKYRLAQEEAALSGTGEITVELGTAEAPPPVPAHTRTGMGTLGGRANWKARVVDFALLPDQYKLPNESLLNSHARSTKGERPIPGVEFYDDHVVTVRTKKGE